MPSRMPPPLTRSEVERLDLSAREVEVLALIAMGMTTAEIAATLYLSVNSIKTHTQHLFRKLGTTTRLQAAVWMWSRPTAGGCPCGEDAPEQRTG